MRIKVVCLLLCLFLGFVSAKDLLRSDPFFTNVHPDYHVYRQRAATHIDMTQNECAKFVNRLFKYRFDKLIWGNAWDTQINDQNLKYLSLEWQIDPKSYDRGNNFRLNSYQDRVSHFHSLYRVIEAEYHRVGIIGFLYRYSFAKDFLEDDVLPQTHVAFLAGAQDFEITNNTKETKTLKEILELEYGTIHEHEVSLLEQRLGYSLYQILLPRQSILYSDYLLEQQFQQRVEAVSLLSVFLQKHRNNRITPILRPVSFSRITNEIFK